MCSSAYDGVFLFDVYEVDVKMLTHFNINILYLGGRGGKTSVAASKDRVHGIGEGEDFEDDSDVSSCSSESSNEDDARPHAKTVRSVIHEVGLALFEKRGRVRMSRLLTWTYIYIYTFIVVVVVPYHIG